MKLEDQVTSLELSKRLKELGVKQESYFEWSFYMDCMESDCHEKHWIVTDKNGGNIGGRISAFTVAELGEMLPSYFKIFPLHSSRVGTESNARFICGGQEAKTEADARAKMLIYLIENKLVKVQK